MSGTSVQTFVMGDVVSYFPDERYDRWWCREGTAIVEIRDGQVLLFDTYWGFGPSSDPHRLTPTEIATAKVQFNLHDYDDVRDEWRWERFAPEDRAVITAQRGLQRRWLVRKGASEHLPTQVENARERVREAEAKVASARSSLAWEQRQLAELEARAANPCPECGTGTVVLGPMEADTGHYPYSCTDCEYRG